jgi:hypothetical protein
MVASEIETVVSGAAVVGGATAVDTVAAGASVVVGAAVVVETAVVEVVVTATAVVGAPVVGAALPVSSEPHDVATVPAANRNTARSTVDSDLFGVTTPHLQSVGV